MGNEFKAKLQTLNLVLQLTGSLSYALHSFPSTEIQEISQTTR